MDRISLTIICTGFAIMLVCTSLVAYQTVQVARIQQYTIELIVRTHRAPTP